MKKRQSQGNPLRCGEFQRVPRGSFLESFQDHCYVRQHEYGEMKLVPEDDDALQGVLSWEYAKRICLDAGVESSIALAAITEEATAIFTMMNKIAQTL